MLTYKNHKVKTSVRRLVEFLLREGDILPGEGFGRDVEAMQEGSRLHKKIQKSQGADYRSEVPLKRSWPQEGYDLVLEGRADGIGIRKQDGETFPYIDEIKCVYRDVERLTEPEPLHLAQAKCYACLYLLDHGEEEKIGVQVTYCQMETEEIRRFPILYMREELAPWFSCLLDGYRLWADYYTEAVKKREESVAALPFPFEFREGQKEMTALVYRAVREKKDIFLQAPTGVGKTVSTLYPAIKFLTAQGAARVCYLTAKTVTGTVAERTLAILRERGLWLKALTLTAKERICINGDGECSPAVCARAKGHYDRVNGALYALLTSENVLSREVILDYAARYQVCPYALSFEAADWADAVICDYNYVFDPHVNRKTLFTEGGAEQNIYLIDEAHNLLERARDMYSAALAAGEFSTMQKMFRKKDPYVAKRLGACRRIFSKLDREAAEGEEISPERAMRAADELYYPLQNLLGAFEDYLADHPEEEETGEIVEFYFRARHFFQMFGGMEGGYETYAEGEGKTRRLHLLCVDPSLKIEACLETGWCAVFFSATLLPAPYYRQLLLGARPHEAYRIPSPFSQKRRLLVIASDVTSLYTRRGPEMYGRIVRYLETLSEKRTGNYMVFFPSYAMLREVAGLAEESTLSLTAELAVQEPSMGEREKEAFLAGFSAKVKKSRIGFCVLGSIFSEGIDLVGDRLIGVCIVGTGLPQICTEREMIRRYFDRKGKKGYDYAYRYPGMNKVLQAAGRVIRTAEDRGVIVLMDDRFLLAENQRLLPEDWNVYYEVNHRNFGGLLEKFWSEPDQDAGARETEPFDI